MPLHALMGTQAHRTRQVHLSLALHVLMGHNLGVVWRTVRASVRYMWPLWALTFGGSPVLAPSSPLGAPHLRHNGFKQQLGEPDDSEMG